MEGDFGAQWGSMPHHTEQMPWGTLITTKVSTFQLGFVLFCYKILEKGKKPNKI